MTYVPAIYIAEFDETAQSLIPNTAFAYVPGMVNLQVWKPLAGPAQIWVPKPFGPRVGGADILQVAAEAELPVPGGVHFFDDWNLYHRQTGEIHCGTNIIRALSTNEPYLNWWNYVVP